MNGNNSIFDNLCGGSNHGNNGNPNDNVLDLKVINESSKQVDKVVNRSPYKVVITWFTPFDGTIHGYVDFSNQCEMAFDDIHLYQRKSLMNYVLSKLSLREFPILRGKSIKTWAELKRALDEHFKIRQSAKSLFKEIVNLSKKSDQSISDFYNILICKCFEYGKFLKSTFKEEKDKVKVRIYIEHAEEFILDSFIKAISMKFRPTVIGMKPKNIEEAYHELKELEIATGVNDSESNLCECRELIKLLKDSKLQSNNRELVRSNDQEHNCVNANLLQLQESRENQVLLNDILCQICGRRGHIASACWDLKAFMGIQRAEYYGRNSRINRFRNGKRVVPRIGQ